MTLQDFLSRLQGVHGTGGEQFMARCPAHDDSTASLSVTMGNKGIVLKCMAGCDTREVVAAMGLAMKDLFLDGEEKKAAASAPARARAKAMQPAKRIYAPGDIWYNPGKGREEKITEVYDYQDDTGRTVLKVARTEHKSFPCQSLGKDGKWYNTKGDWGGLLYNQPGILTAKEKGEAIYVVEGEKDAINLGRLGFVTTCNPGGGAQGDAGGKWKKTHTQTLAGAREVYLIPDLDAPGEGLMTYVAGQLTGKVEKICILRLEDLCPELPAKGDVTDFFKLLGKEKGLAAFAQLRESALPYAPPQEPNGQADNWMVESEHYLGVWGYCVEGGKLCKVTNDGNRPLAAFVPYPVENITKDDGVSVEQYFVIDGWGSGQKKLPRATVSAATFAKMQWPMEQWGYWGNLLPVQNAEKQVRYAISEAGKQHAQNRTVYTHTGWRKIEGRWAYLYNGGAIGAQGVSVELEGALEHYSLKGSMDLQLALSEELALMSYYPAHIILPLLGAAYLAPLWSVLERAEIQPSFVPYVLGVSGSYKSTLAALVLSHFGTFHLRRFTANFHDTANQVRLKAFLAKDALFVVDDFHPEADQRMRAQMSGVAKTMLRAWGDGADRGRLTASRTLDAYRPPRSIGLMTGEDLPDVTTSDLLRMYLIQVGKGDIVEDEMLKHMESQAREGAFRTCMAGYIEWLAPQMDGLGKTLLPRFLALREEVRGTGGGRIGDAVAHLMLGLEMMIAYLLDAGVLPQKDAQRLRARGLEAILANSVAQRGTVREESPSRQFVSTLQELIGSKAWRVMDLTLDKAVGMPVNMMGYRDEDYYYLLPGTAYGAVHQALKDQDNGLKLKKNRMLRQLVEDGFVVPDSENNPSRVKRILGRNERVLFLRRSVIDGEGPGPDGERLAQMGLDDVTGEEDMQAIFGQEEA